MKIKIITISILASLIMSDIRSQITEIKKEASILNSISALRDTLAQLSARTDDNFFKIHCQSMISVIDSKSSFTTADSGFLSSTYTSFSNLVYDSPRLPSSYINRKRKYIISWISPTDGEISFTWFRPPKIWNPDIEYPLYIQLHGLWSVASNSIEYMTYPFRTGSSSDVSFDDGYLLEPWGRGNLWYEGISKTDIWECIDVIKSLVKINSKRQYLSGHSMGGYGAWYIASESPKYWAALGIHAGALEYDGSNLVNGTVAETLKDLPTYFVCGTSDGLLNINQTAYQLLGYAGNTDTKFVTFSGGHDYLEPNVQNMYLWMRKYINTDWTDIKNMKIEKPSQITEIQNYPNPAKSSTTITYSISRESNVVINLNDLNGRTIQKIMNEVKAAGKYKMLFNTSNLAAGTYLIVMRTVYGIFENKMVIIK